jgi:hypothetical protein
MPMSFSAAGWLMIRHARAGHPSRPLWDYVRQLKQDGISPCTGAGEKTGMVVALSDELIALVVGGVLHRCEKQGWAQAQLNLKKKKLGVCSGL